MQSPTDRASYSDSAIVMLGWYASVTAAIVVAYQSLPSPPAPDCAPTDRCPRPLFTPGAAAALIGIPLGVVLLVVSLVALAGLVRVTTSAVVAGTAATWASPLVLLVGLAVWRAQ